MSFFGRIFQSGLDVNVRSIAIDRMKYMADDGERVYRNMISYFAEENKKHFELSPKGLCKARLHAVMFGVLAARMRYPGEDKSLFRLFQAASGIAYEPLSDPESKTFLGRERAEEFAWTYSKNLLTALIKVNAQVLDTGSLSAELLTVRDFYNEALLDSVGNDVSGRRMCEEREPVIMAGLIRRFNDAAMLANDL